MSGIKAAFPESHSIIKTNNLLLHRRSLPQFVSTMNCRVNRSIGKSSRDVKNTDFLSILYTKTSKKL